MQGRFQWEGFTEDVRASLMPAPSRPLRILLCVLCGYKLFVWRAATLCWESHARHVTTSPGFPAVHASTRNMPPMRPQSHWRRSPARRAASLRTTSSTVRLLPGPSAWLKDCERSTRRRKSRLPANQLHQARNASAWVAALVRVCGELSRIVTTSVLTLSHS